VILSLLWEKYPFLYLTYNKEHNINEVHIGVIRFANYTNMMLSVCPEGQTDDINPNLVTCNPFGLADNE